MSKRHLSPDVVPEPKRAHTSYFVQHRPPDRCPSAFERLLYDELILVIFSHLSWSDLCAIQPTNRNWSRLSLDNQLWKSLYINEYGRTRLRGIRGFTSRGDGREVKALPGRAKSDVEIRDWKWMFRISCNWRTGRCSVEQLSDETKAYSGLSPRSSVATRTLGQSQPSPHLVLAGDITIFTAPREGCQPKLTLSSPSVGMCQLPCPSSSNATAHITALVLDQSRPSRDHYTRVVSFLITGEFTIFSINHSHPSNSTAILTFVPSSTTSRNSPIIQAVYHHPLLITLSESFHLSLYDLSSGKVIHTQTLSSFTSYPPSSLVLSSPSPGNYKLVLAYAIPVYPAHWTVGATELIISSSPIMSVSNTRTTKAFDIPAGWVDEHKMQIVREQWGRKVLRVADTQTDGKWVVLAPGDPLAGSSALNGTHSVSDSPSTLSQTSNLHSPSSLQLYRLYFPSSSSPPKLTFIRSLHGHIGPVSSLALSDGRCVSLGVNGSVWVWDLEGETGAEVSTGDLSHEYVVEGGDLKGSVVFDERRIITADTKGVLVRRFDI